MENIDIRACLNALGDSWRFSGSVTDGTETCWDAVMWEDARQKPSWAALVDVIDVVRERLVRELFKQERAKTVASLVVLVDIDENTAYLFDGDETSQTRMTRAMVTMTDTDVTPWVLADNTPVTVTKAQLAVALRKAAEEQTRLWVIPSEKPVEEIEE